MEYRNSRIDMTKNEKIKLVACYYGLSMKDAKKYVEEYDNENPNGKAYKYMIDFMNGQGRYAFWED